MNETGPVSQLAAAPEQAPPMKRSWLVQRLQKPHNLPPGHALAAFDNVFSFGGGLRNGGLSGEAMDLLRDVFRFDYMGAAEFEWGAVPEALSGLAEDEKRLMAFSFTIPLSKVGRGWRERDKAAPHGSATIYVLCRADHAGEAERRIRDWAKQGYKADLKESLNLTDSLLPTEEWHGRCVGWLELDNGFLFFTDETMWQATAHLFGVHCSLAAASDGRSDERN